MGTFVYVKGIFRALLEWIYDNEMVYKLAYVSKGATVSNGCAGRCGKGLLSFLVMLKAFLDLSSRSHFSHLQATF